MGYGAHITKEKARKKKYTRGKEVRKYFHNLKIQVRRHITEESSGRTRGENRRVKVHTGNIKGKEKDRVVHVVRGEVKASSRATCMCTNASKAGKLEIKVAISSSQTYRIATSQKSSYKPAACDDITRPPSNVINHA